MNSRINRALAVGVVAAALLPALTGCSTASADSELEQSLSKLSGVNGAFVWTTTDGSPTNRGIAARLYIDENPGDDLTQLLDDAFRTMWAYPAFEPTAGVSLQVAVGERPESPRRAAGNDLIEIGSAFLDIPWKKQPISGPPEDASVSHESMTMQYGEWTGGN